MTIQAKAERIKLKKKRETIEKELQIMIISIFMDQNIIF